MLKLRLFALGFTAIIVGCSPSVTSAPVGQVISSQSEIGKIHFHAEGGSLANDTLYPIYPNPYSVENGDTALFFRFGLQDTSRAILLIQNPIGDEIALYVDSTMPAGTYSGAWHPASSDESALNPGIYFITFRVNDTITNKGYINSQVLNLLNN